MKAIGYVRVSTDLQVREGVSLEMQIERIEHYAAAFGLNLVEIIADEGLSGKNVKGRPGLQRALDLCFRREVDVLVVYKLDRLARNTKEALDIAERLNVAGVGLRSLVEHIDTQSAIGRLYFTFGAGIAQFERELTGERTKAALAHKRSNGQASNHPPYGWNRVGEKLERNEAEQAVIERMVADNTTGMTFAQIAVALNAGKVPAKRGGKWHPATVKKILRRK